jgi:hypothetical protein
VSTHNLAPGAMAYNNEGVPKTAGIVAQSVDSLSKQGTPNKKKSVVKKLQMAVHKHPMPIQSHSPRQSIEQR